MKNIIFIYLFYIFAFNTVFANVNVITSTISPYNVNAMPPGWRNDSFRKITIDIKNNILPVFASLSSNPIITTISRQIVVRKINIGGNESSCVGAKIYGSINSSNYVACYLFAK